MDPIHVQNTEHKNLEAYQALLEVAKSERTFKTRQGYSSAYVLSLLLPPSGLFYFVKYIIFSGGDKENIKAGVISLALSLASLLITFWMVAGISTHENMQSLKNLTVPENQKQILQLLK